MAQLLLDANGQADIPTLILETKSGERYGAVDGITGIRYKNNLNSANEAGFTLHKYVDGKLNPLWEDITDLKTLFIPEYHEKFELNVSYTDEESETKSVTAVSLCESELSQIILRNFEVNTETDIGRDDYELTVFYNPDNPKASLLHRVLSTKAASFQIGAVDSSLRDMAFEYSADNIDIYSFLTGNVAEQMQCLFLFDSMTRTISVRDLCSICNDCYEDTIIRQYDADGNEIRKHYRGDFRDVCPVCGSRNITPGYGNDTSILIDRENLAQSVSVQGNAGALKNCFYVEGGDDAITAAFCLINPNGTQYLYYFPPDELDKNARNRIYKFPDDLIDAINEYNRDYKWYYSENIYDPSRQSHIYHPETESFTPAVFQPENTDLKYITAYNRIVDKLCGLSDKSPFRDCKKYSSPLSFRGHGSLVTACYNSVDLDVFIRSGMMPSFEMEVYSKEEAILRLSEQTPGSIAISGFGSGTVKTVVNNAVLMTAKTVINTALFSVGIESSRYSTGSSVWTGKFVITDLQDDNPQTNTIVSPQNITLTINGDMITYCKSRIRYMLSKEDLPSLKNLYDLTITDDYFREQIKLHSIDNLSILYNVMQSCLDILQDQTDKISIREGNSVADELNRYYGIYHRRMGMISAMISERENDLKAVRQYGALIYSCIDAVRTALDFPSYLKRYSETHSLSTDLWEVFNRHRREDTYHNSNLISDALESNSDVIRHAGYLMEFAQKELVQAGTLQYTVSASLSNLLVLPEFARYAGHFDTGNWIRIRTDIRDDREEDSMYRLRLLSWQISFDEIQNIEVEFSTAAKTWSGMQDAASVIQSAQNMATSYDGVKRQAEKSSEAAGIVDHWVTDGLDMTNRKIVNSADSQSLVIDEHGLLARSHDELADIYDPCQLKLLHNGLYTTHDNWETVDTGIGKFIYNDPQNNFRETVGYGLIAKTIIGSLILGENLGIYNKNGSLKFDKNGLSVSNGKNTININPGGNAFEVIKGSEKQMYIDMDGNVNIGGGAMVSWFNVTDTDSVATKNYVTSLGYQTAPQVTQITKDTVTTSYINALNITAKDFSAETITGKRIIGSYIEGADMNGGTINIGNGNFFVDSNGNGNFCGSIHATDIVAEESYYISTSSYRDKIIDYFINPQGFKKTLSFGIGGTYINIMPEYSNIIGGGHAGKIDINATAGIDVTGLITGTITNAKNSENAEYAKGAHLTKFMSWMAGKHGEDAQCSVAMSSDSYFRTYDPGDENNLYHQPVSDAAALGSPNYRWKQLYVSASSISTSDRSLKRNIKNLTGKHLEFFMRIEPVSFLFRNGGSGRTHVGFIAQDVENAMKETGLTDLDFAGFCKDIKTVCRINEKGEETEEPVTDEHGNPQYIYSLRYGEFIALNTHAIQQTRKELQILKNQYSRLAAFTGYQEVVK